MRQFPIKRETRYLSATIFAAIFLLPPFTNIHGMSQIYYISPNGSDSNDGSITSPFKTIKHALSKAYAGDVIFLQDGVYREEIVTVRSGEPDKPIIIKGSKNAIVKGSNKNDKIDTIVDIKHSYITLEGFTVDGHYIKNGVDMYKKKLIYITNANNIKILNMTIKNGGEECIRLRYFSSNNEIAYNLIRNCGIIDFKLNGGGKNGELIYIGTAPEQLYKNPTSKPDASNYNWIHHNKFEGIGSECVDIKEGSMYNIIENNDCSGMVYVDSGAISIRGNYNEVRNNIIHDNLGSGIRLGGDTADDGIHNKVYNNHLYNNNIADMKIMSHPQDMICSNTLATVIGTYKDYYKPSEPCK